MRWGGGRSTGRRGGDENSEKGKERTAENEQKVKGKKGEIKKWRRERIRNKRGKS